MTTVTLTLPQPPPELHPNGRVYWRKKATVKQRYAFEVGALTRSQLVTQAVEKPLRGPVTAQATFVYGVRRRRDPDNCAASLKACWDSLVSVGLLEDDDFEHLHLLPVLFEVVPKAQPCLRVRLEGATA